jgi:hypothetical protein
MTASATGNSVRVLKFTALRFLVLIKRDHAADCLGEYGNWGESWAFLS